jgi:hypothetical protein
MEKLHMRQYIIPSYVHPERSGGRKDDFLPAEYIVIEGDRFPLQEQIERHHKLDGYKGFKLVLLCWSGKKSIHGWYKGESTDVDYSYEIAKKAVYLGFDCCSLNNWQPIRLPGGWNSETNNRQSIIEINI